MTPEKMIKRWRDDPVYFVRECFGVEPDEWQKDFLRAFATEQRIAAKACKGPGKTAVLAWCCWNFLATRVEPKIAATSITGDNLRDGLWTEMSKWQGKSEILQREFEWKAERITQRARSETWWMAARRWSQSANKEQQANALAGLHADSIMFVIDEAGGVPDAVMAAAEAALSTEGVDGRLLICGNPTHLSGPLYRACSSDRSAWHTIEITGDPDDPKRSPRISKEWARKQIKTYGAENPWVLVNVFGKFPPSSLNGLLGPDDMTRAILRVYKPDQYQHMPKVLGVDVARDGADKTVIAPRWGMAHFKCKEMRIPDTVQIAGVVAQAIQRFEPDAVNVDGTGGYGAGVVDTLRDWGYSVNEIHFSSKALDRQYFNKRAEMLFEFANAVRSNACLPNDPELIEEATAAEYFFKKDQIQIAEKDQIKEKIGRSPDKLDAYALCHALPVTKKQSQTVHQRTVQNEYDPIYGDRYQAKNESIDDYNPLSYN